MCDLIALRGGAMRMDGSIERLLFSLSTNKQSRRGLIGPDRLVRIDGFAAAMINPLLLLPLLLLLIDPLLLLLLSPVAAAVLSSTDRYDRTILTLFRVYSLLFRCCRCRCHWSIHFVLLSLLLLLINPPLLLLLLLPIVLEFGTWKLWRIGQSIDPLFRCCCRQSQHSEKNRSSAPLKNRVIALALIIVGRVHSQACGIDGP